MVAYAKIGTALESFMGWEAGSFMQSYRELQSSDANTAVTNDPVMSALIEVVRTVPFEGTAQSLLDVLNSLPDNQLSSPSVRYGSMWPRSASALSRILGRKMPLLRQMGMIVENRRTARGSNICINIGSYHPDGDDSDAIDATLVTLPLYDSNPPDLMET